MPRSWHRVKDEEVAAVAAEVVEGRGLVKVEATRIVREECGPVAEEKTFRPYDPQGGCSLSPVPARYRRIR